ncbi:MAG TPA: S41 family peptidase [Candidatus Saccharimonadales bacterium]|nr:S41 family peptidase [Candidatus Saccharimonadales bacterium]
MFGSAKANPQPEKHHVKTGPHHHRWSFLKILAALVTVLLVFGGGVAVGRGDVSLWGPKTPANASAATLNYSSVNQVYNILKNNFDGNLDQGKLIDGLKTGLVDAAGDPYTEYFDPKAAAAFNDELSGSITGIGAEVGTDSDNNIVVVSPLSGYPAEQAGLKPKDIIAGIDGKPTQGMSVDTAVSKIRGNAGTQVTLTIVRDGGNPFNVNITRQKITVPSVTYKEDGDIGYLKVSQFTNDTVGLAQKAAQEFKSKGVKGVVLDLRGDPGGYLSGAVGVSSLWLDSGKTVVSERRGSTIIDTEYATGNDVLHGLPTVVLIDSGSASASEITAGALHDNGQAELVGVTSFGKGSVQQVIHLSGGAEMKVTIAHWYTPDGKNINKQGIVPDVSVTNSDSDIKAGKDPQKDKAYAILQSKIQQ